jgi:hypothetical protein
MKTALDQVIPIVRTSVAVLTPGQPHNYLIFTKKYDIIYIENKSKGEIPNDNE